MQFLCTSACRFSLHDSAHSVFALFAQRPPPRRRPTTRSARPPADTAPVIHVLSNPASLFVPSWTPFLVLPSAPASLFVHRVTRHAAIVQAPARARLVRLATLTTVRSPL